MKGGKREGSGRPKKETKILYKRVPAEKYESIKQKVEEMIKAD